jgi:hypothetical protein
LGVRGLPVCAAFPLVVFWLGLGWAVGGVRPWVVEAVGELRRAGFARPVARARVWAGAG